MAKNDSKEFQINECNDVFCSIARNPHCPEDILIELSNSDSFDVKKSVIHNPNCPIVILDRFTDGDTINLLMLEVLKKNNCPIYLFDKVISKLSSNLITKGEMFSIIARNSIISVEDFQRQICNKFTWTKEYTDSLCSIAKNPRCPTAVLNKLYKTLEDFDIYPKLFENVISGIGSNPKCSKELLYMLANSNNSKVREGAARNSNLPVELIEKLSKDSDINILASIAAKSTCPEDTLRKLYKIDNAMVRVALASNPSLPSDLILVLVSDPDYLVRSELAKNPCCPHQFYSTFINDKSARVVSSVLSRKNIPDWMIRNVLDDHHIEVRITIASNSNLNKYDIELLSKDKDDRVRESLAKNPLCSYQILSKLAKDNNKCVVKAAIKNPNCPTNTLMNILEKNDIELTKVVLEVLGEKLFLLTREYDYYKIKLLLLENNNVSEDELMDYIRSTDPRICLAIAEYSECPLSVLDKLTSDTDPAVRKAAESNYKKRSSYLRFKSLAGINKKVQEEEDVEEKKDYIEELSNNKKEEDDKEEELRSLIFANLERNRELSERLELLDAQEKLKLQPYLKIRIPESELFIKVNDHYEIKDEYLPYLEQIDFVFISTENLKVSGIDWSKTNINIDPQKVYNKDLSYTKFADHNISFKNFDGCILIGADLSEELDSYGFENAIVDKYTKLPNKKQISRNR